MDIALMRTRFDEIDEQKIYEKGQQLGKKIGECIGRRQGEHIGRQQGELIGERKGEVRQRMMLQQMSVSYTHLADDILMIGRFLDHRMDFNQSIFFIGIRPSKIKAVSYTNLLPWITQAEKCSTVM